jgi:hypothetical protein
MKWWEYLDILSVEAKLYLHGKDRFVNKFGILFSILCFVTVSILSSYFLLVYLRKSQLNIVFFEHSYASPEDSLLKYDLVNQPVMWSLVDQNNNVVDESIIRVFPALIREEKKLNLDYLNSESCDKNQNLLLNINSTSLIIDDISKYKCLKISNSELAEKDFSISHDVNSGISQYLNLYTIKCENFSQNNNILIDLNKSQTYPFCKSKEEIENFLSKSTIYLKYSLPYHTINHYNISHPLSQDYILSQDPILANSHNNYLYNFHKIFLKLVNYTTDRGIVMEDFETVTAIGQDFIHSKTVTYSNNVQKNILSIHSIQLSQNFYDCYTRTYAKLQAVLASIGGVVKFIFTLGHFICKYISKQMLSVALSNFFTDHSGGESTPPSTLLQNQRKTNEINKINTSNWKLVYSTEGLFKHMSNSPLKKLSIPAYPFPDSKVTIREKKIISDEEKVSQMNNRLMMNNLNLKDLDVKKLLRNNKNFKKMTFREAMLPFFCQRQDSLKFVVSNYTKILKSRLSSNYILKVFSEFDNFKYLLLDEDQKLIFENLKYPSIQDHLDKLRFNNPDHIDNFKLTKLESIIRNLKNASTDDKISKGLLNLIHYPVI